MNVVSLSFSYPPARRIGAEVALHALNLRLAREHRVTAVCTQLAQGFANDGITVRGRREPLPSADVVIVNAGLARRAATLFPRRPLVVWAHNVRRETLDDIDRAARAGAHVVSNSAVMRDALSMVLGVDSLVLHPPVAPAEPVRGGSAVTLVNLSREKGSGVLWDLAAANPRRQFLGVKGGYGRQDVRSLPNVEVVEHGPLDQVWPRTGVLLLPSGHESWGMVGVEAGWRGIPVLASDLPGVREALGPGAVYVPPNGDWQAGLARLDAHRPSLSTAIRRHVAAVDTAVELDATAALVSTLA